LTRAHGDTDNELWKSEMNLKRMRATFSGTTQLLWIKIAVWKQPTGSTGLPGWNDFLRFDILVEA